MWLLVIVLHKIKSCGSNLFIWLKFFQRLFSVLVAVFHVHLSSKISIPCSLATRFPPRLAAAYPSALVAIYPVCIATIDLLTDTHPLHVGNQT